MTAQRPGTHTTDVVDDIVAAWRRELPEVAGLPLELTKRIGRLFAVLDAAIVAELARLDLTKAEYEVLARLRAAGSPYRLRPHELASSLSLSSGGTTNVVHRLTGAGLAVREAHPDDRRGAAVRLTAEGRRMAEKAVLATNDAQRAVLHQVPERDGRALADLLREVLLAVDRR